MVDTNLNLYGDYQRVIRDWRHASKIFRSNVFAQAPKNKFLFHVYFNINTSVYPVGLSTGTNFGVLVKDIKLPTYTFNTHVMNQYNRKRIVQTKIRYEPVQVTFHDDNANQVTQMWNAYYIYYYKDGSKPNVIFQGSRGARGPGSNGVYNTRNIYINNIVGDNDWGYVGEAIAQPGFEAIKIPFFKDITCWSFYQNYWTAYTLINPIITQFAHDQHAYDQGNGVMTNNMTLDYETVVYNYGQLDGREPGDIVTGFGQTSDYDRTVSPTPPNSYNPNRSTDGSPL